MPNLTACGKCERCSLPAGSYPGHHVPAAFSQGDSTCDTASESDVNTSMRERADETLAAATASTKISFSIFRPNTRSPVVPPHIKYANKKLGYFRKKKGLRVQKNQRVQKTKGSRWDKRKRGQTTSVRVHRHKRAPSVSFLPALAHSCTVQTVASCRDADVGQTHVSLLPKLPALTLSLAQVAPHRRKKKMPDSRLRFRVDYAVVKYIRFRSVVRGYSGCRAYFL